MKKKSHVVYIITKLELGGAQKVCLSLFEQLPDAGQQASIITGTQGPLVSHIQDKPNIYLLPQLTREVSPLGIFKEIGALWALIKTLRVLKKKHGSLIVHTHSTKAGLLGRWAAWFAGVTKRVHTIHGYGFHAHQNPLAWLVIYLFELVTSFITAHYVCVSSHDVAVGIKLFPRFTVKHSIIRAAVQTDKFVPAQKTSTFPEADQPFVFGTVACFKAQKNLFDLLEAFKVVYQHNPHTRLELIGDGTLRPEIEQWIAAHQLQKTITLHGWQHEVASIMSKWHAFVLSSLWEGLPCAIVEARLLGLPVLSYNTGGIYDVIVNGKNGFLYQQKQWQQLAHGMLALTINPTLHKKLHEYDDDLSSFEISAMVQQHSKLYQQLK